MYSRLASLLVAGGYLIAASVRANADGGTIALCAVAVVIALPFIWFPELFGDYFGPAHFGYINRPTPAVFVAIGGWIVLIVVPLVLITAR